MQEPPNAAPTSTPRKKPLARSKAAAEPSPAPAPPNILPFAKHEPSPESTKVEGAPTLVTRQQRAQANVAKKTAEHAAKGTPKKGLPEPPAPSLEKSDQPATPHALLLRAMAELKDGKAVQAYETLSALEPMLKSAHE